MRIYVGNMSYQTSEETLSDVFAAYGEVEEVAIINDRDTGRPRGFAFVTMADGSGGSEAIEAINGTDLDGRTLVVNEARPRERRSFGGGGGGGGDRW